MTTSSRPVRRQADRHRSPDPRRQGRLRPQRHHPRAVLPPDRPAPPRRGPRLQAPARRPHRTTPPPQPHGDPVPRTLGRRLLEAAPPVPPGSPGLGGHAWTRTPACQAGTPVPPADRPAPPAGQGRADALPGRARPLRPAHPRGHDGEDAVTESPVRGEAPSARRTWNRPSRPTAAGPPPPTTSPPAWTTRRPPTPTQKCENEPAACTGMAVPCQPSDGDAPAPSSPSPLRGEGRSLATGERGTAATAERGS